MGSVAHIVDAALRAAGEVFAETVWPTCCVLCDTPGNVLCRACEQSLSYLDWWRACPRCGAALGLVQCCACAPPMLERLGRSAFPFAACASATTFDDASGRIVRTYKDQGERRLANDMARLMARCIPPEWHIDVATFVTASTAAYRHRGFDHAELLARAIGERAGIPVRSLLLRPRTRDQRALSRRQRVENMSGMFKAVGGVANEATGGAVGAAAGGAVGKQILLIDDVLTTGATACAATDALLEAGALEVRVLTFARV